MSEKKKDRTIFRVILFPLFSVLAFEVLFMMAAIVFGGVIGQLNQNAKDMLAKQTENREHYLEEEMIDNWSNLDMLSAGINDNVWERLERQQLSLADLNSNNTECVELLKDIYPDLISTMYNKQVSGIFVVFNTKNLDEAGGIEALPGIYLRDLDPTATPSERNADLLLERAPTALVQSGRIATDSGWQPAFSREDSVEQAFFYNPFQAAYLDDRMLEAKNYGYWTAETYSLSGTGRTSIAYSIPLILEDGTVYGVLGIELLTDYVQSLLPYSELSGSDHGAYLLATTSGEETFLNPVVLSSDILRSSDVNEKKFVMSGNGEVTDENGEYYGAARRLVVYNNHAPFDSDKWYLVGISSKESLFAFSRQMQALLVFSVVMTFAIGLVGILLVSYRLSRPIRRLSAEVEKAQKINNLPELSSTGIREIDQFASSISYLGREVVEASTRFLGIMNLVSVDLAGYDVQESAKSVYVTDNYFPLLGMEDVDASSLTPETFVKLQKEIHEKYFYSVSEDGSTIYSVPQAGGTVRYLRSEYKEQDGRLVGVIEDITASALEKMRIERERDCDNLTKLYARRGFRREADALFLKPEILKHAALLMIDLDNLKSTNDRFGHNFGDLYIQTAGRCFVENTPGNTLCARMSGDEFIVLFYGYDSREEIREKIDALYQAIGKVSFVLPNGENMGLSASGGVAWFPEDSTNLSELMKYADFAMYQVKRSKKGTHREFDAEVYSGQTLANQCKLELHQMLETKNVNYHFQPIFESREGKAYAYEALMRVPYPTLGSPETVLRLAREEGRMHDVECLTIFRSSECYMALLERGAVEKDALLFINSIANESMTEEEEQRYHEEYAVLQQRVVIEITEADHMDMELVHKKSRVEGFSGIFALDDYGSGYNSEINLLELHPRFVKVDISIVRGGDSDHNKQQIVNNIVDYAHKRDMLVVAEGLETAEELRMALELDVDLLQGFFLARPGEVPPAISEEALRIIREHRSVQQQ